MKWNYINSKYIDGMLFVPVTSPSNEPDAILIENLAVSGLIEYINKKGLLKAYIQGMSDFNFLLDCTGIEYICIELRLPFAELKDLQCNGKFLYKEYDVNPLYKLDKLKYLSITDNEEPIIKSNLQIDISRFRTLQVYYGEYKFVVNLEKAISLKSLALHHYAAHDLNKLSNLKLIDTIQFTFSKLQTLKGCRNFNRLTCLYLSYNRALKDISELKMVKSTLRILQIENCPNIEDFSVLRELENLEYLELTGSNSIPSLAFLKNLKKLKVFLFNVNVLDGNLSYCMNVPCVHSEKNRKHYNFKDNELPKEKLKINFGEIESWRLI